MRLLFQFKPYLNFLGMALVEVIFVSYFRYKFLMHCSFLPSIRVCCRNIQCTSFKYKWKFQTRQCPTSKSHTSCSERSFFECFYCSVSCFDCQFWFQRPYNACKAYEKLFFTFISSCGSNICFSVDTESLHFSYITITNICNFYCP